MSATNTAAVPATARSTKYAALTLERLVELVDYDAQTGIFTRKVATGRMSVGGVMGSPTHGGYIRIVVLQRSYLAHVLAWFIVHKAWPPGPLDHINLDPTDNRITNLRVVSPAENVRHSRIKCVNRSGAKGVILTRTGRFTAQLKLHNKSIYLGTFGTLDEAAHAYNKKAIAVHGEFAVINPIGHDKPEVGATA